jgi:hypothetical protein
MKTSLHKLLKSFLLLSVICFLQSAIAQAPNKMSYQAIIRNASNVLVANTNVGIKISILQTTATGTAIFVERHTPTTNTNGLATIEIGGGILISGNFASINWANGPFFIKTETDPTGGINYTISGTSQLLSVPFAMYAASSGTTTNATFVTSETPYTYTQTIRDEWVDCPDVSITVPVSGVYLLTFFGGVENTNYYPLATLVGRDTNCLVRVIAQGESEELFSMKANITELDNWEYANFKFYNMQPSRSAIVNLIAGQVLKIQYQQGFIGDYSGETWDIKKSGISILKVGN